MDSCDIKRQYFLDGEVKERTMLNKVRKEENFKKYSYNKLTLSGVKVKLWKQENSGYTFTKEVTTNSNGYYTFTGLCKGIYKVALVTDEDRLVNGYPVVNPKEHIREVNNSVSGLDFTLKCEETLPCQCIKNIELPKNYIKFEVSHPGNDTYFKYTWVDGVPDYLQGYTEGWCVDTEHTITPNKEYTGLMLSSIPGPSIYTQAQWNKVNYIINKRHQPRHQPGNNYSWEEVQNAIWAVLGQTTLNSGDHGYDLWQDAEQNGGNYTPRSGEWAAALIVPISDPSQLIIVEVDP